MLQFLGEIAWGKECIATYDYGWFLMKKSETPQKHLLLAKLTKSFFGELICQNQNDSKTRET
jgi:hypothetical protein